MTIRSEFQVHILNEQGIEKATQIAEAFSKLLVEIEHLTARHTGIADDDLRSNARELAIVRTKLQEAAFFAKRAMAVLPENQR